MSEKYYVIMEGEYSDKSVQGVTKDLELAKAYCKVHNERSHGEDYWVYDSEGFELITDKEFITEAQKISDVFVFTVCATIKGGYKRWKVRTAWEKGLRKECGQSMYIHEVDEFMKKIIVYTTDKNKAEKVAYDTVAKMNAEEIGL